jgi:uncharacterized protein YjbI with pentapeptide repeats
LENAAVCTDNVNVYRDGGIDTGELVCARFDGADLHGANLRHVRHCVWLAANESCRPATSEMLRTAGHANLTGAQVP